jgi:hypothetical protein
MSNATTETIEIKVGTGATYEGWTDRRPYEVVRVVSEKCLEVRSMKAELDPEWKPEIISGGFVGHCVNQRDQKWIISSDSEASTIRIRLGKRGWRDAYGGSYTVGQAVKFHDYNF